MTCARMLASSLKESSRRSENREKIELPYPLPFRPHDPVPDFLSADEAKTFASDALKKHATLLKESNFSEANLQKMVIADLIRKETNATPDVVECFAQELFNRGYYLEAIGMFEVAAYHRLISGYSVFNVRNGMWRCGLALSEIAEELLQQQQPKGKAKRWIEYLVFDHILTTQCRFLLDVQNLYQGMSKILFVAEIQCYLNIEWTQSLVKFWDQRAGTIDRALKRCIEVYGEDRIKLVLFYGELLSHLGCTLLKLEKFRDAAKRFKEAKVVFKKCKFYNKEMRKSYIKEAKYHLHQARARKPCKIQHTLLQQTQSF